MLYVFDCWNNPALFQTGWFVESLLTQTLIIHIIRTAKIPFLQSRASPALISTSLIICAIGIALPFRGRVEVHATTAALLAHYRKLPIELRNPDASGQNLVRPPLGHVNSGQEMTDAGEVVSLSLTHSAICSEGIGRLCHVAKSRT